MRPRPAPPSLARRLLSRVLPADEREEMLGSLDDLFAARARATGPGPARRWYWRQIPSFALRLTADRAVRMSRTLADPRYHREIRSMDALLRDVRHAARVLLRRPVFTGVAVLSLALGIGANTAMFSLVNAVLLRPLPVEDVEELVEIYTSDSNDYPYATSSWPDFRDLREANRVFESVAGYQLFLSTTERGDGPPEMVMGELVSGDYFTLLGVRAGRGRILLPTDDLTPGGHPVAVLSHRSWQRDHGGDPGIVGRTIRLNQRPFTVVGVLGEDFTGLTRGLVPDAWVPFAMIQEVMPSPTSRLESRGSRSMFVKGRLADGVTAEAAAEWLEAFSARLAEAHPETNGDRRMTLLPTTEVSLHPIVDRALVPVAALLLGVVGLVLLIACANLASFLLARAERRRKDVAVRLAMGAGRFALVRQFLVETTLLALGGGLVGVVLASALLQALLRFQPPMMIPVNLDVTVDARVLAFTAGVAALAGILFGLAPALQATRGSLSATLKDGGDRGAAGRTPRMRNVLVAGQVALSLVMLTGAGLFLRSLREAQTVDPGFYTGPAAILWPNFQMSGLDADDGRATLQTLEERLRAHPAVDRVTVTDLLPLGAGIQTTGVRVEGVPGPSNDGRHAVDFTWVGPGWFEVMDIPLRAGRPVGPEDVEGGPRTAVVSEAFVARFFPDAGGPAGAVGRTFEVDGGTQVQVVGVSADTKVRTLGEAPRPRIHYAASQQYLDGVQIVVRGQGSSAELLAAARTVAREVSPGLVLMEAKTMEQHLALMLFAPRMAALLLGAFGALGLLLAAIGVFGVVSYAVATRTREIGIRVSLGATPSAVVAMVVGGGMRLVAAGAAVGLVMALGAGTLLSRFLIGVGGRDPATFVGVPVLLCAVALVAAWLPARRAAGVDPSEALRSE